MPITTPQVGVLTNAINKSINGANTLNNPNATTIQQAAALSALATAASNVAVVTAQIQKASPTVLNGVQGVNALLTINNLNIQSQLLTDAIATNDSSKILQASLDFGASVAGTAVVIAFFIPALAIAPEALAISLLITAAASLYRQREPIGDVLDRLLKPNATTGASPPLPLGDHDDNGIPDILEGHWIIDPKTKSATDAAKAVLPPRRDPLTFDLDGDGLETTAIAATNPILFDHDGDGVKNGTGWVKPDDGFLVRDVNGNGSIDNGRELFGDSTILTSGARAGQNALDGFDALSDLDSIANGGNADGKISNLDTQFSNLRIWRDLNQDGISQMGDSVTGLGRELFTLTELGIASINIAKTSNSQTLSNGNQIADIGSYTKTDGSQAAVGEVTGNLADINLASDTFHRSFPNMLDTTSVATLPDMQGSGAVRDLRDAANDAEWRAKV